ncbi:MAG TPA: ABC transporter permease [Terriglobales bacterium]|nr:ABC transporter permease [Terriglobales bacterium]
MKILAFFRSVTDKFFHRSRTTDEMEEELRPRTQFRTNGLENSGLDREVKRRAPIEFKGRERVKDEYHGTVGGNFFEVLFRDIRLALRVLRKSPGFTIIAVLTLALAIGANAMVFSMLNALILRPLNVPQAESLYGVQRGNDKSANQSYPDYLDLRDRNRSFDGLAAFGIDAVGLDTGNGPSEVYGYEVTGNYFDVLGIQPYLGRFFHSSDEHGPNSAPYVVLPYSYWHSHFQEDRGVVGRVVQVNKHPFTILGVAPPEFYGTFLFFHPDFFVPIVNQEQVEGASNLDARGKRTIVMVLGHLKPGVSPVQAVSDLNSIGSYLEKTYPKDDGLMNFSLGRPSLDGDLLGGPAKAFLTALMLLAGLILLAACANLGSLFAARAADRSREVALRLALGSSRKLILRQVFTEAVLVSLLGGVVGLLGSVMLLRELSAWRPAPQFPNLHLTVTPDANVYWVALLLALVSGFLFGAVPVRQILHTNPLEVVKSGSSGRAGRRITIKDLLLVVQIAICALLVTSSLVALRGLTRSLHGNFGFEPRNAMLVNTVLSMADYTGDRVPVMQKRMIDALQTVPGVKSVGLIDLVPLSTALIRSNVFTDKTTDLNPSNAAAAPFMYCISPEYFHTAGTALLAGRTFSWHDDKDAPRVAVVNQEFARKIFGSVTNAMDKYYKMQDGTRIQVVGVVEDGKYLNLTEDPQPAMFLPFLQLPSSWTWTTLVIRSDRDPQQLSTAIRSTLRDLDAGLPFDMKTWTEEMDTALFASHIATVSLGVLGGMGAMLSITGIFGLAAYSVSKRLRELGIRMALGAQRKEVLQAALGWAFKLLAFGSAAGLLLGILASRVLAFIVYQATPRDPLVLGGVVFTMLLLGLVATWIPAQRSLSVNPSILLREE